MNGIWYLARDGKNIGEIIYIKDSDMGRRLNPFLIVAIGDEVEEFKGVKFRSYYIIQPNRRKEDRRK